MNSIKAIFLKQTKDMFKNPAVFIQFVIFPAIAFVMTEFIAKENPDIPQNMFVTMMASIFAGMALITTMASVIAEDTERKSLRFLVMAGVKPYQYLIGVGGFILIAGIVVAAVFALIGSFTGTELAKFFVVMALGVVASVMLGATLGILAKNQQVATAIGVPIAMVLGFAPMIAQFNEGVKTVVNVLYTQQLNVIVNNFSANFPQALLVIGINIAVFVALFIVAYKKKGLRF